MSHDVARKTLLALALAAASPAHAAPAAPSPVPLWVRYYDGPAHLTDLAGGMVADNDGNVYVTGYGESSGTGNDIVTAKYDTAGSLFWVETYDRPGVSGDDFGRGIALDGSGNVYVTGESYGGAASQVDIVTIKYSSSGVEQWAEAYDGPSHGWDQIYSRSRPIAVDPAGNAYVTGFSVDGVPTLKYSSDGTLRWARLSPGGFSGGMEIALGNSGAVYVAGNGASGGITTKYSADGDVLWAKTHGGRNNAIALDAAGSAFVTGSSDLGELATLKYDGTTGALLWLSTYQGGGSGNAIAVDSAGRIDVGGSAAPPTGFGGSKAVTIQYDSFDGRQRWAKTYGSTSIHKKYPSFPIVDLALDGDNVVVLGPTSEPDGIVDLFAIKYDSAGRQKWVATFDSGYQDTGKATATDFAGNIYVSGKSGVGTGCNWLTLKYAP